MTTNEIKLLLALTRHLVRMNADPESPEMQALSSLADTVRDEHNAAITAMNEFMTNPTKALLSGLRDSQ